MNENYEQPKKSGTVLKVVLVIITLIAVVAAAAMGLLYYNATTNLELVREKNEALGVDRDKYKELAAKYETQIAEFEEEIADLTEQLAEAQSVIEAPLLAGQQTTTPTDNGGDTTGEQTTTTTPADTDGQEAVVNLNSVKTLDVKPKDADLYDEGVEYKCIVAGLNLRSGPSTSYRTVGSVTKDATVTAYADDGDWLLVKTSGDIYGWVKTNYVKKS